MSNEMEGMKITISADVSGAIKAIQDFHNKFRNMANSINANSININTNMKDFNKSVGSMGNIVNMTQMAKMQKSIEKMNQPVTKTKNNMGMMNNPAAIIDLNESMKTHEKIVKKAKISWLALGVAATATLYGIIKGASLAQMWMSELGGILGYFLDTALTPLSSGIEWFLNILWKLSDWFAGLDPIIQGAVGLFGLIVTAIVGIASAWVLLSPVVIPIIEAIIAIIGGILSPIGLVVAAIIGIVAIAWYLYNNWDQVVASIGKLWDWLGTKAKEIFDAILSGWSYNLNLVKNVVSGAYNFIKDTIVGAIQGAYNIIVGIIDKIKNAILSVPGVQTAINIASNAVKTASSYLGYAQGTQSVPATGLYKLHSGEQVIPKGESNTENNQSITFSPTINVNATIGSSVDIRNLATQLSNFWKDDMQRFARGTI